MPRFQVCAGIIHSYQTRINILDLKGLQGALSLQYYIERQDSSQHVAMVPYKTTQDLNHFHKVFYNFLEITINFQSFCNF